MNLLLIVLLPFVGSVVAAFFRPNARNAEAWLAGIVALVAALTTASLYPRIAAGEVVRVGSRVALVQVRCWQQGPDKPIAVARGHFLLTAPEPKS